MSTDFFEGKRVLIMGLGQFGGGVDSAIFAYKAGGKVTITDLAGQKSLAGSLQQLTEYDIEYHLGGHREEDFANADIVVVNPAVGPDNRFVQIAHNADKAITSQIEIFFQLCPCQIVGITGANGKSTTTALTAHLLAGGIGQGVNYKNVWLGGNIGDRPLLDRLDRIYPEDVVVLELSSFQLEQLSRIQKGPHVSVITNLTPNHLDRYGRFEAYCDAKEHIFKFQKPHENRSAVSIFNAEDAIAAQWFKQYSNETGRCCLTFKTDDVSRELAEVFSLPGRANLSNLAAAATVARYFGLSEKLIAASAGTFEALEHRLELVAQIGGVSWYNDSIATTPASTIAALDAFETPRIIIAGGYDKGLSFDELAEKIACQAKTAILIGKTSGKIAEAIRTVGKTNVQVEFASSMAEAVNCANGLAESGDVVLLSPACASYDMFTNFRQRGQVFRKLVRELQR